MLKRAGSIVIDKGSGDGDRHFTLGI